MFPCSIIFFLTTLALVLSAQAAVTDLNPAFQEAVKGANRFVISIDEKRPLEVDNAQEVSDLIRRIKIDPEQEGGPCLCIGNGYTWEFFQNEKLLKSLFYKHESDLRWFNLQEEITYAVLTDESVELVAEWLSSHGIKGPKRNLDASYQRYEPFEKQWLAAMPKSLISLWDFSKKPTRAKATPKELHAALAKQYPETKQQIIALLEWLIEKKYPTEMPFSDTAETLLDFYSTEQIASIINEGILTPSQFAGAALEISRRSIGKDRMGNSGWIEKFEAVYGLFSPELRIRLVECSLAFQNQNLKLRQQLRDQFEDERLKQRAPHGNAP